MVLKVVSRLNFSSCGNRNGFSFEDARLHLNGRFYNQILKGLNLISWYLSFIKSRIGGEFTLFDTFSF